MGLGMGFESLSGDRARTSVHLNETAKGFEGYLQRCGGLADRPHDAFAVLDLRTTDQIQLWMHRSAYNC